ncbi:MAG: imidazole glycerol phosphate synthase subunit HisF [Elusimicrobia bacterium GWA2_56_46]|nr:MAG: imidazole glycerol phosphate synthase subunit HisF [Elusimicrobia bacterium GWA2_56_46]OGR55460.1 MAG: imidazole glycerol phosphate synthase subunit HisF [Elusimicrobia bacterium GWC2_56_31]HBW21927.1 imidazole glycerol phosphate synthase subunit HisF [Elusimicrobiota bacterium]
MKNVRIIPRLDIKGPNLVKGIHMEGLRVLGQPWEFARHYYENGADELIFVDVVASLYQRNSLKDIISKTARETFIPLTVAGGIRTIENMKDILRAGADKVAINTAAIQNPEFIRTASRLFGSSTIVVSIEAMLENGKYLVYTDNGREYTGVEALAWAKKAEELGAGEILLTSIDREGTGEGFDEELTIMVSKAVSIPVIACGGCGTLEHVAGVILDGGAEAVSMASVLHYAMAGRSDAARITGEGNTEFLRSGRSLSTITPLGIGDIKKYLRSHAIPCRHELDGINAK